jgi:hypothetical protein
MLIPWEISGQLTNGSLRISNNLDHAGSSSINSNIDLCVMIFLDLGICVFWKWPAPTGG